MCVTVCACVCLCLVYLGDGVCVLVLVINSSGVRSYSVVTSFCVEITSYFAYQQSFSVWEIPRITLLVLQSNIHFFLSFFLVYIYFFFLWRNSRLLNSNFYHFQSTRFGECLLQTYLIFLHITLFILVSQVNSSLEVFVFFFTFLFLLF